MEHSNVKWIPAFTDSRSEEVLFWVPMPEPKLKSGFFGISRDQVFTYAAEFLVLLGTVLVYRLAANWGESQLDSYVVVRRTISFLQPILLIGSGVALTRFLPRASGKQERRSLYMATLRVSAFFTFPVALLFILFPSYVSGLAFGDDGYRSLMPPVGLMLIGLNLHSTVYAYWRGRLRMGTAGVAQVLALALIPNIAFIINSELTEVFWFTGIGWILVGSLFGLWPALGARDSGLIGSQGKIIRYGAPRLPGDLALASMLTVPVFVAANLIGVSAAGKIGFGITLLNMVAAAIAPLAILLLPQASGLLAERRFAEVRQKAGKLALVTVTFALAATLAFELLAPFVLELYLGPAGVSQVGTARILFLAAVPYAYFLSIRSLADAYYHTPQNGINQLKSLVLLIAALLVCWVFSLETIWIAWSVVVSMVCLMYLTWRSISQMNDSLERLSELDQHPVRILVVIPAEERSSTYPFSRRQASYIGRELGAEVRTYFLNSRSSVYGLWRASKEFKRLVRDFNPEVVHVHYGSVSALFTVLNSSAPVVITFLGSDLNPTRSEGRIRDILGRLFSQIAAYFASGLICVSKNLRDRLWWRRDEVLIAPLGAELDVFFPMDRQECRHRLGWTDKGAVVLFNGNNPIVKRLDIAKDTIQLLQERGVDVRLHVLSGKVPFKQIPILLNACNAVLICSDSEGSPSMVKEAMACNVPVVSNDVGDVKERLEGVEPGGIYEQSAESLASGLEQVLRTNEASNGRTLAARNKADAKLVDKTVYELLKQMTLR